MNATVRALPAPSSRLRDLRWELRDRWDEWSPPAWAKTAAFYGALVAFGSFWGMAIAFAGVSALLIAVSLLACFMCLRDFRNGTVLLVLIMPIANSYVFPHAMFGITGLNPLNMLIGATLVVYLMQNIGQKGPPLFPRSLVWLFLVPMLAAAILGMRHVDEIPYTFRTLSQLAFTNEVGYFRDLFLKPFILVLYAVLVGAAA